MALQLRGMKMECRSDAITNLCNLVAAYRHYHSAARNTYGAVSDAWQAKASRARNAVRLAIFAIRETDFAGEWLA